MSKQSPEALLTPEAQMGEYLLNKELFNDLKSRLSTALIRPSRLPHFLLDIEFLVLAEVAERLRDVRERVKDKRARAIIGQYREKLSIE